MTDLTKVEIKNIFKRFDVKFSFVAFPLLALISAILNRFNHAHDLFQTTFFFVLIILLCTSIMTGTHISHDFEENTIRNKIIKGKTREEIYFSKFLSVTLVNYLIILNFLFWSVIFENIILPNAHFHLDGFMISIAISIMAILAISSLTVFLSMFMRQEAGGLVPTVVMFMSCIFNVLTYGAFSDSINTFLARLPVGQLMEVSAELADPDVINKMIYSLVYASICYILGLVIFKKTDLK